MSTNSEIKPQASLGVKVIRKNPQSTGEDAPPTSGVIGAVLVVCAMLFVAWALYLAW